MNVLIVDDSRMSRMLLSAIIDDTFPDANLIEAEDGEDALEKAGRGVDIATLDFNMPGMDGLTLARALRGRFPQAKIAMFTAAIQDEALAQVNALNVRYIPKPITEENVKAFLLA